MEGENSAAPSQAPNARAVWIVQKKGDRLHQLLTKSPGSCCVSGPVIESGRRERRKVRVLQGHHGERQRGVEVLQRFRGTPKHGQVESQSCLPELASCPCPTKRNAHEPLANQGMCRSPSLHRHLAQHLGEPSELAAERKECEVPKRVNVEPVTHERPRSGAALRETVESKPA